MQTDRFRLCKSFFIMFEQCFKKNYYIDRMLFNIFYRIVFTASVGLLKLLCLIKFKQFSHIAPALKAVLF